MPTPLTAKVVAYSELSTLDADDSIDWAIELLQLGYETPSLLMLASLSKPVNSFELRAYLKKALLELNLEATGCRL